MTLPDHGRRFRRRQPLRRGGRTAVRRQGHRVRGVVVRHGGHGRRHLRLRHQHGGRRVVHGRVPAGVLPRRVPSDMLGFSPTSYSHGGEHNI